MCVLPLADVLSILITMHIAYMLLDIIHEWWMGEVPK